MSKIALPTSAQLSYSDYDKVAQNKMIFQSFNMPADYYLAMEVVYNPERSTTSLRNLIHVTQNATNCVGATCAMPAIHLLAGGTVPQFTFGDASGQVFSFSPNQSLLTYPTNTLRITAVGRYVQVSVNGYTWTLVQPTSRASGNATLYFGNPWEPAASTSQIRSFKLTAATATTPVYPNFSPVTVDSSSAPNFYSQYIMNRDFYLSFDMKYTKVMTTDTTLMRFTNDLKSNQGKFGDRAIMVQIIGAKRPDARSQLLQIIVADADNSNRTFVVPYDIARDSLASVEVMGIANNLAVTVNKNTFMFGQPSPRFEGVVNLSFKDGFTTPSSASVSAMQFRPLTVADSSNLEKSSTARVYKKYNGASIEGGNMFFYAGEPASCYKACDLTDGCVAFTVAKDGKGCFLKSTGATFTFDDSVEASYVSSEAPQQRYIRYPNATFTDTNNEVSTIISMYETNEVDACRKACSNDAGCFGFKIRYPDTVKQCFLKKSLFTLDLAGTMDIYIPMETNNRYFVKYPPGTYGMGNLGAMFIGNLTELSNSTLSCEQTCDQSPSCVGFMRDSSLTTFSKCYYHSTLTNINNRLSSFMYDAYVENQAVKVSEKNNRKFVCGVLRSGGSFIAGVLTKSIPCEHHCNMFPGCIAYKSLLWNAGTTYCALMRDVGNEPSTSQTSLCILDVDAVAPRAYQRYPKIAFGSAFSLGTVDVSMSECPSVCDRTEGCAGYTVMPWRGCELLRLTAVPGKTSQTSAYDSYFVVEAAPPATTSRTFIPFFQNHYFTTTPLEKPTVDNSRCASTCLNRRDCIGYQYNESIPNSCELRDSLVTSYYDYDQRNFMKTFLTLDRIKSIRYTNSTNAVLLRGDRVVHSTGRTAFMVHENGVVSISHYSVRAFIFEKSAINVRAGATGQLEFKLVNGVESYGTAASACTGSEYRITTEDEATVKVKCSVTNVVGYSSEILTSTHPFWAFWNITRTAADKYKLVTSWGTDVRIYYLDSGLSSNLDPADALPEVDNVGVFDTLNGYEAPTQIKKDYFQHGTLLALMAKSKISGFAQAASVVSLKITEGNDRFFTEKSFVKAVAAAVNDKPSTVTSRIINFSGSFYGGNSPVVNCAIQWAFFSKVAVIAAAGNDGAQIDTRNPYQFTVGSFVMPTIKANLWDKTNFGQSIDIWAPNSFIAQSRSGTSFATGFVSAVLAGSITLNSNLRGNPNAQYKFLSATAKRDLVSTSGKVDKSFAGLRSLTFYDKATSIPDGNNTYFNPDFAPDYCTGLGSKSTPDWPKLIGLASETTFGGIVTTTSTSSGTYLLGSRRV